MLVCSARTDTSADVCFRFPAQSLSGGFVTAAGGIRTTQRTVPSPTRPVVPGPPHGVERVGVAKTRLGPKTPQHPNRPRNTPFLHRRLIFQKSTHISDKNTDIGCYTTRQIPLTKGLSKRTEQKGAREVKAIQVRAIRSERTASAVGGKAGLSEKRASIRKGAPRKALGLNLFLFSDLRSVPHHATTHGLGQLHKESPPSHTHPHLALCLS